MCACLAPKWAGLVGRSMKRVVVGGGQLWGGRWPTPETKSWARSRKKTALTSSFSPHDVRLLCWTSSELLLCLSAAFISPDISAGGGGGRGVAGEREHMRWNDVDPGQLWCFFVDSWSHLQKQTALFFSYRHKTRHAHPHTHSEPKVLKELKR